MKSLASIKVIALLFAALSYSANEAAHAYTTLQCPGSRAMVNKLQKTSTYAHWISSYKGRKFHERKCPKRYHSREEITCTDFYHHPISRSSECSSEKRVNGARIKKCGDIVLRDSNWVQGLDKRFYNFERSTDYTFSGPWDGIYRSRGSKPGRTHYVSQLGNLTEPTKCTRDGSKCYQDTYFQEEYVPRQKNLTRKRLVQTLRSRTLIECRNVF